MVLKTNNPNQGDIWLFDPDPVKGKEIGTIHSKQILKEIQSWLSAFIRID